tara:strand:+ start:2874 stop:3404 length:531 start_codon:yes stop_codon:yes gene_type:complete
MKFIKKKKPGYVIWVTGLSGSGKTSIAKGLKKEIESILKPTIVISGDDIRKIFKLKGHTYEDRKNYIKYYSNLCKFLSDQNVNVIFAVVGLFEFIRKWNRENLKNYIEVYIKSDLKKIIKLKRKNIYTKFKKNIVGRDIIPEFPQRPDIIVKNNLNVNLENLIKETSSKIKKMIRK